MSRRRDTVQQAVLYARFSPRPNAAECDSSIKQLADMREFSNRQGWEVRFETQDDDESGEDRERTGLAEAIAACKRGDVLLVRDWDRLARDTAFTLFVNEDLQRRGVQLWSMSQGPFATDDPAVEVLSTIFAAFAKYQRLVGSQRTRRRMRQHMAGGRQMSGINPYGWCEDETREQMSVGGKRKMWLVPVEEEQAIIRRIVAEFTVDKRSYRGIASRLNSEGVPCRRGPWSHKRVLAVLVREKVLPPPKKRPKARSVKLA